MSPPVCDPNTHRLRALISSPPLHATPRQSRPLSLPHSTAPGHLRCHGASRWHLAVIWECICTPHPIHGAPTRPLGPFKHRSPSLFILHPRTHLRLAPKGSSAGLASTPQPLTFLLWGSSSLPLWSTSPRRPLPRGRGAVVALAVHLTSSISVCDSELWNGTCHNVTMRHPAASQALDSQS